MKNKKHTGLLLFILFAFFSVFLLGSFSAYANPLSKISLSLEPRGSIAELQDLRQLPEIRKKLSSDLLGLIDENMLPAGKTRQQIVRQMDELGQISANLVPRGTTGLGESVYVYVSVDPSASTNIVDVYGTVTNRDDTNHLAVAWLPVEKLEALVLLDEVRAVRTVIPPITRSGSVTSEGDFLHKADLARVNLELDGTGIKIGVISDGVNNRAAAQASGDLPADLTVIRDSLIGDEGTAMLEIIHDLAPGAKLYFHDCGNNILEFTEAIDALVAAGCNIIVDDIGWITEPFFTDGIIAQHIDNILADPDKDVVYVSATGNDAQSHYQGEYYQLYDSGWHDFSHGNGLYTDLYVHIPDQSGVMVVLQWNDPWGASGNDYDLYLDRLVSGYSGGGYDTVGYSIDLQDGNDLPLEWIVYINDTGSDFDAAISVKNHSGAAPESLEVYIYPIGAGIYENNIIPDDSIFGHPAVPGVLAVGAIHPNNPEDIAGYSSLGPVTLLTGVRNKPDICGIAGVSVTGAGGLQSTFYGTSAAAPHVAAIAALVWSKDPSLNASEVTDLLTVHADDRGNGGYDLTFGHGFANALTSATAVPELTAVTVTGSIPTLKAGGSSYNLNNLTVTGLDQYNNPYDLSQKTVTWAIYSGSEYVSLTDSELTPINAGTGTVTATVSGITSNPVPFTVNPPPVLTTVTVTGSIPTLTAGGATNNLNNLTAAGFDQYSDPFDISQISIIWEIQSGSSYATLSGSVLTPVSAGAGAVTATVSGISSNPVPFTVNPPPVLTTVTVDDSIPTLTAGGTVYNLSNLTVTGFDQYNSPYNLSQSTVTWEIYSGSNYATLNGSVLTPVSAGTGTVTATVSGITSNHVTFIVNAPSPVGGGGGGPAPVPEAVVSTTGSASINPVAGGTVGLGNEATVEIPSGALQGTNSVEVAIRIVKEPPPLPSGFMVLGIVYEFTVGGQPSYNFNNSVTLTFTFDPEALVPGEQPSVFYFDETKEQWISVGGIVSGNTITVNVDHFTKYSVMAVALNDISGHWADVNIRNLLAKGAISGYPDGTFRPNDSITRAEFAAMLVKAFKLETQTGKTFEDTLTHWANESIATAAYYGIVSGYNDITFGPNDPITREQMAAMIVKAKKITLISEEPLFKDNGEISAWARSSVSTAVKNGIISGYPGNTFNPKGNATRAEAVTVILRALQ